MASQLHSLIQWKTILAPNTQAGRPWKGEGAVLAPLGELGSRCRPLAATFLVSWLNGSKLSARPGGSQEHYLQTKQ